MHVALHGALHSERGEAMCASKVELQLFGVNLGHVSFSYESCTWAKKTKILLGTP